MVKQTIQIFARVKPTRSKTGLYEVDEDDEGIPRLTFTVPKELAEGFINNKKEAYKYRFEHVFDQSTKQDEVFELVSKPVVNKKTPVLLVLCTGYSRMEFSSVLTGYNGTIFAYGQTGSGKTFTITGGAEKYVDRGIIPRTLSYLFEKFEMDSERSYTLHVSYLELYNERGYDLLDPKHESTKLEDLPKVTLMEDSDQNIHLKNLSVHQATTEEEALNLLFLGDTNRMIAETPMNQASTRSHCIFTIHITSRETGSATIRRSKLHLVDLAGSERVSKSGVNGLLLQEAKYINSSLHFLEQVIIALSEKNRQHIPYRNSMMTSVLRDSLGGNCMTTMIATCSIEKRNLVESISTCRFAQRVAMIKNDVMVNEELDPKLLIQKLKREVQQLKEELAMATGEQRTDALSEEDLERCEELVNNFLEDTDPDGVLTVGADMRKIQACFQILKRHVLEKPKVVEQAPPMETQDTSRTDTGPYSNAENDRLKDLVLQRDNEINILVNMLKKEKKRLAETEAELESFGRNIPRSASMTDGEMTNGDMQRRNSSRPPSNSMWNQKQSDNPNKTKILGDMSVGRQEAFELFQRDYEHNDAIKDTKQSLKQRYVDAKTLGQEVNESRNQINHIKSQIEHHRMQLAVQGLIDPNNPEPDEEEQELRNDMELEKVRYKDCVSKLKGLKNEIEHLQHLLEKSRVKLMKDFELWWAGQATTLQHGGGSNMKSAWRTPTPQKSNRQLADNLSHQRDKQDSNRETNSMGYRHNSTAARLESMGRTNSLTDSNTEPNMGYRHSSTAARLESLSKSNSSPYNKENSNYKPRSAPEKEKVGGKIPLTGDPAADADIIAFMKARQQIRRAQQDRR